VIEKVEPWLIKEALNVCFKSQFDNSIMQMNLFGGNHWVLDSVPDGLHARNCFSSFLLNAFYGKV
jgi:hypothetical protein